MKKSTDHEQPSIKLIPTEPNLARRFKEATGLAPHQYLIRCRVERARVLLSTSGLTIAEVAHRVGFADQSHLDRHFKHLLGVSPSMLLHAGKNVQVLDKNVQD